MAGANTGALSGIAKEYFAEGISEGVNNSFPLTDVFKRVKVDYKGGEGEVWSHHKSRNVSPMFTNEDSLFAVAGVQGSVKGRKRVKKGMARLRMTQEAMDDLVSSEASFRNGVTDEKTRIVDDIAKRREFALSADGRGVFALLDSGSSGTTLELDAPGNITGDNFGNRFIQPGMALAAINPVNGAIRSNTPSVTAVNSDGTDITVSADPSWTENDYIVQAANTAVTDVLDTAYEAAPQGLHSLIDDGTIRDNYFGISRTDVPSLKSYVVSSVGAFSLDVAQRTADVVNEKLGGEIDLLIMHHSVRREYIKLLQDDRRYTQGALMKPDGGTAAFKQGDLTLGEVPVKAIRSVGLTQVYFLDTKKSGFQQLVAEPGRFVERGGDIWLQDGTGSSARHAFEAWYFWRDQNFAKNPGYNARWDGVTGQTLVVVRDE